MSAWRNALIGLVRLAQESLPTVDAGIGEPCYEAGVLDKVLKPNKIIMRHIEALEAENTRLREALKREERAVRDLADDLLASDLEGQAATAYMIAGSLKRAARTALEAE